MLKVHGSANQWSWNVALMKQKRVGVIESLFNNGQRTMIHLAVFPLEIC